MSLRGRQRYSQLAQEEQSTEQSDAAARKARAQRINGLAHSAFWCGLAVFIIYYGSVYRVLTTDPRVLRTFLYLAYALALVQAGLIGYMAFYLPWKERRRIEDYNKFCPEVVQATVACGLLVWLLSTIALWPVWGWFTPVITTILGIAAIFFPNFLPSWCC